MASLLIRKEVPQVSACYGKRLSKIPRAVQVNNQIKRRGRSRIPQRVHKSKFQHTPETSSVASFSLSPSQTETPTSKPAYPTGGTVDKSQLTTSRDCSKTHNVRRRLWNASGADNSRSSNMEASTASILAGFSFVRKDTQFDRCDLPSSCMTSTPKPRRRKLPQSTRSSKRRFMTSTPIKDNQIDLAFNSSVLGSSGLGGSAAMRNLLRTPTEQCHTVSDTFINTNKRASRSEVQNSLLHGEKDMQVTQQEDAHDVIRVQENNRSSALHVPLSLRVTLLHLQLTNLANADNGLQLKYQLKATKLESLRYRTLLRSSAKAQQRLINAYFDKRHTGLIDAIEQEIKELACDGQNQPLCNASRKLDACHQTEKSSAETERKHSNHMKDGRFRHRFNSLKQVKKWFRNKLWSRSPKKQTGNVHACQAATKNQHTKDWAECENPSRV